MRLRSNSVLNLSVAPTVGINQTQSPCGGRFAWALANMKSIAFACILFPGLTFACSISTFVEPFEVAPTEFENKFDENDFIAQLPAPKAKVTRLTRGTGSDGYSCTDAGMLSIELIWPKTSVYSIDEVGFYFRVISGETPDMIFPLGPVTGTVAGDKMGFTFVWLDGAPSQQQALNLAVEVFAVNKGLEIGKSANFRVSSEIR